MQALKSPPAMGSEGFLDEKGRQQNEAKAVQAAQEVVQRLLALENDPAMSAALTPRLRNNIAQRIMEFQRAGVPLNLNP